MRYTQDPSYLILPTEATIKHLAKREGMELTEWEFDFVWDLLAKTGGAQVAEFDEDTAAFDAGLHAMTEAEAFAKEHPNMDYDTVYQWFRYENTNLQRQLHEVLEKLDLNEIPGYNHAAKAVRAVKIIRNLKTLMVMATVVYMVLEESLFEMIENALQQVKELSDQDLKLLEQFGDPLSEDPGSDAEFLGVQLQLCGMNLHEVLRIARHLDTLSELQRGKAKLTSDPNGEDMKMRGIRDLSELGRIGQQDFALPPKLRMKRAVEGELYVREPNTRRNKKQLLFLVVDGTGSMMYDGATSASRAAGVVMNRLQAVIDGDAEVYLRFFDRDLRKTEYHAHDAKSARELMTVVTDPTQYNGGSTIFTSTLATASSRVQELMKSGKLKEPELVFVTDGTAEIPGVSVLQGVKMHVVQVGENEVPDLSELAKASGGINVYAGCPVPTM